MQNFPVNWNIRVKHAKHASPPSFEYDDLELKRDDKGFGVPELNTKRLLCWMLLVCALTVVESAATAAIQDDTADGSPNVRKPNIVLINLDDCDVSLVSDQNLEHYPNIRKLAKTSTRFTNCHVTTPLCGPSRACLFRSQYAHNTGYRTNRTRLDAGSGFTGGTQYFQDAGLSADQLPVWLQNAGYHTMLVGKYFQDKTDHIPVPGWNRFIAYGGNSYFGPISRFNFYPDGKIEKTLIMGYRTELEANETIDLLDEYAKDVAKNEPGEEKPFFLYLAPVAPHVGPVKEDPVPEQWSDRFKKVELPTGANFNEDDVSDKPVVYRDTLKLSDKEIRRLKVAQRRRLIAMLGIDDMVRRIRNKIADIGQEKNTIVILTSDHGYLMGQHRMHGKSFPLVEATKVPLWINWPETTTSRDAGQLLAHIDISATIAELGGAKLPDFADGRSFAKLLGDESIVEVDAIRQAVLVENWESRLNSVSKRKVVYSSMIGPSTMYTQWATGEKEYYDLEADPNQLDNSFESLSASEKDTLRAELHSIRQNSLKDSGTTATLSFPTVNRKFVGPETELEGFVESGAHSEPIEVSIQRKSTGEYWNGSSWDKEAVRIPTEAPAGAGLLYEWHAEPRIAKLKAGETLTIEVHSESESSQNASIRKLDVVFDNQPPKVRITRPVNRSGYPEFSNFGGLIEDDHGPDDVKLSIFNLDTEKYFDGSDWVADESQVSVFVNVKIGKWHARHPLPDGRYEVTAIGRDAAGNWSEATESVRCVVDRKFKTRQRLEEIQK